MASPAAPECCSPAGPDALEDQEDAHAAVGSTPGHALVLPTSAGTQQQQQEQPQQQQQQPPQQPQGADGSQVARHSPHSMFLPPDQHQLHMVAAAAIAAAAALSSRGMPLTGQESTAAANLAVHATMQQMQQAPVGAHHGFAPLHVRQQQQQQQQQAYVSLGPTALPSPPRLPAAPTPRAMQRVPERGSAPVSVPVVVPVVVGQVAPHRVCLPHPGAASSNPGPASSPPPLMPIPPAPGAVYNIPPVAAPVSGSPVTGGDPPEEVLVVGDTNAWISPSWRRMVQQLATCGGYLPSAGADHPQAPGASGPQGGTPPGSNSKRPPGAAAAGGAPAKRAAGAASTTAAGAEAGQAAHVVQVEVQGVAAAAAAAALAVAVAEPAVAAEPAPALAAEPVAAAAAGAGSARGAPASPAKRGSRVAVVVPLRVVAELDGLKHCGNGDVGHHAREANRLLREVGGGGKDATGGVGAGGWLRFETQTEYLAGRERVKQLPLLSSDDDIVQCAAYLQQQIQDAGQGGKRLVLLCSADNNVVGGKVHAVGVRPVFLPALEPHLNGAADGAAMVHLLLELALAALAGSLAQLLRRPAPPSLLQLPAAAPAPKRRRADEQEMVSPPPAAKRAKVKHAVSKTPGGAGGSGKAAAAGDAGGNGKAAAAAAGGAGGKGKAAAAAGGSGGQAGAGAVGRQAAAAAAAAENAAGGGKGTGGSKGGKRKLQVLNPPELEQLDQEGKKKLETRVRAAMSHLQLLVREALGEMLAAGKRALKAASRQRAAAPDAADGAAAAGGDRDPPPAVITGRVGLRLLESVASYAAASPSDAQLVVEWHQLHMDLLYQPDQRTACRKSLLRIKAATARLPTKCPGIVTPGLCHHALTHTADVERAVVATVRAWQQRPLQQLQALAGRVHQPGKPLARHVLRLDLGQLAAAIGEKLAVLLPQAGAAMPLPRLKSGGVQLAAAQYANKVVEAALAARQHGSPPVDEKRLKRLATLYATLPAPEAHQVDQVPRMCSQYWDMLLPLGAPPTAALKALLASRLGNLLKMKDSKVIKMQAELTPHLATVLRCLCPDGRRDTAAAMVTQHAGVGPAGPAGAADAGDDAAAAGAPAQAAAPRPPPRPVASAASIAGADEAPPGSPSTPTAGAAAAAAEAAGSGELPDWVPADMDISVSTGPAAAVAAGSGTEGDAADDAAGREPDGGQVQDEPPRSCRKRRRPAGWECDAGQAEGQGAESAGVDDLGEQQLEYPQGGSEDEEGLRDQGHAEEELLEDWEVAVGERGGEDWAYGLAACTDDEQQPSSEGEEPGSEAAAAADDDEVDGFLQGEGADGRVSAADLLQHLLTATSSDTPLDMTVVFDALAAAVAGTMEALWALDALRSAPLVRHAHGMCPVPGVTPPLEVVEYCQQFAELLLPPAQAAPAGQALSALQSYLESPAATPTPPAAPATSPTAAPPAPAPGDSVPAGPCAAAAAPGPACLTWAQSTAAQALPSFSCLEAALGTQAAWAQQQQQQQWQGGEKTVVDDEEEEEEGWEEEEGQLDDEEEGLEEEVAG